jgi:beta-glucosidase
VTFGVQRPRAPAAEELAAAVDLARSAEVAVVVVDSGRLQETEGADRRSLRLPNRQDVLVSAVAAVNPRTVVVVNAGAPVAMPWRDDVAAVLVAWFPGQEFGNALADVLLGVAEPGGRLPTTWGARDEDVPVLSTRPVDGLLRYDEGLHVGHRAWLRAGVSPAYPFGHGLGYTTWSYVALDAPPDVTAGEDVTVVVRLRNAGRRAGTEVVQVYLSRSDSAVDRPERWLAGFAVVTASPGEEILTRVRLAARAFQHWSVDERAWATEPGTFHVAAGRSVSDLLLSSDVESRP